MSEHVPARTDLAEQRVDAGRVAQIALQVLRRRRLVLAYVHHQHVVAAIVKEFCDRGSDP